MIEAIGWLAIAAVVMIVGKAVAKKLWPEDWNNDPFKNGLYQDQFQVVRMAVDGQVNTL